jgi:molybdopterin biosynthesis enzyme
VRSGGRLDVTPLPWTGSSDLVGLATADGLLVLPAGGTADAGCGVDVLLLEGAGRTTPSMP